MDIQLRPALRDFRLRQGYGGRVDGQVGATCRDDGMSFRLRQAILQKAFTGQRA